MALTSVFLDNFADVDATLLTAHTPDDGTDWTLLANSSGDANANINNAESSVNQPFQTHTQWSYYMPNFSEAQSDTQEIEITIGSRTVQRVGLQIQNGTTDVDGYSIELPTGTNQKVKLFRVDEGVDTQLDTADVALGVAGDVYRVRISASGDISVDLNSSPLTWITAASTTVNDTTYTGGNPSLLLKRSYTSGGATKFEAFVDIAGTTAAITGTAQPTQTEVDVVTGGKTIILTLTGDTWVAAGATFDAQRQAIIDGLDSAQSELTGWNNEVRDKEVVGAVVRTSDTVVTITLSASASFDITATEIITATIPAAALVTETNPVVATPTFTVTHTALDPTLTLEIAKNNTGQILANEVGVVVDVYTISTGALVLHKTGQTSDAGGIISFSDAALAAATEYRVVALLASGARGIGRVTTT